MRIAVRVNRKKEKVAKFTLSSYTYRKKTTTPSAVPSVFHAHETEQRGVGRETIRTTERCHRL